MHHHRRNGDDLGVVRARLVDEAFGRDVHAEIDDIDHQRLQAAHDDALAERMQVAVGGADDDLADDFRRTLELLQHLLGHFRRDLRGHEVLGQVGVRIVADLGHHFLDRRNDDLEDDVLGADAPVEGLVDDAKRRRLVGIENRLVVGLDDGVEHERPPLLLGYSNRSQPEFFYVAILVPYY